MYIIDKIYTKQEGLERYLKSQMLENTEDNNQNLRGTLIKLKRKFIPLFLYQVFCITNYVLASYLTILFN